MPLRFIEGCSTITLNHTRELYLLVTEQLVVQDFSPGLLKALERTPDQISGRALDQLFEPRRGSVGTLPTALEPSQDLDLEYHKADGSEIVFRSTALPLGEPSGGYLLHLQDRTREVRAKDELFHLARLTTVGRLFSGMVHEINNTLSGIIGYAQLLMLDQRAPEIHGDLRKILDEALRTAQLVENVLSFLRLRAMKMNAVRLTDVLEKALRLRGHALRTAGIRVQRRLGANLPLLAGDEILLRQVFVNVITNAEKSMMSDRRGGKIKVHARQVGSQIRIVVSDDGPGVPPGLEEKIFNAFFSTRAEGEGCGLGLAICRDILELHEASIQARRRRGRGASFVLWFQVTAARPNAVPPVLVPDNLAKQPFDKRLRVVVIDDEQPSREVICRAFGQPGNEVLEFADSEAALRHIVDRPVDLIVSDIHRPGVDGIGFYQRLKARAPALAARVIFVTGDVVSDEVARFLQSVPPARQLRKPIQIQQLIEAARLAL